MIPRLICRFLALTLALTALATPAAATPDPAYDVKVLIITAFDPEERPWIERLKITRTFPVQGLAKPVRCTEEGICILTTRMGKANAAISLSALLTDPPFDLSRTIFLAAGLGGAPPQIGTIGSVAWAQYILDFDLIQHLVLDDGERRRPFMERQVAPVGSELARLNPQLVDLAHSVTEGTPLADSQRAQAYRAHYPGQAGRVPTVLKCDTVASDNYWHGQRISTLVAQLMKRWTNGAGTYCTTEMEESAIARALARFGHLDRYLSLRGFGNFDQPYPGQSVQNSLRNLHQDIATENLFRVGYAFVQYLLVHRAEVLAKAGIH